MRTSHSAVISRYRLAIIGYSPDRMSLFLPQSVLPGSWLSWIFLLFPVWNLPWWFWTIWISWLWPWIILARMWQYLLFSLAHLAQGTTSTDHPHPRALPQVSALDWNLICPGPHCVLYVLEGEEGAEMGREWAKVSTIDNIPFYLPWVFLEMFGKT